MGRYTRRRTPAALRWVGIPLVVIGLGLVPFGVGPALAAPDGPSAAPAGSAAAPAASAAAPAAPSAPAGESGAGMPCSTTVKACARLSTNEAWLADGKGTVRRGPVRMNHGAPGQETPTGTFSVQWKDATHVSGEKPGAKMPWSVFFDGNGRAFHGGDPSVQSAGCVRLAEPTAKFFFENLQPGDAVQILP